MRVLVLLSLAVVAALAAPAEEKTPFVVGGVNAIPGEFPYIVSLQWVILGSSTHVCGGSILNNVWVLSAAHCLTEIPSVGRLEILAGLHNQQMPGEAARIGINRQQSIIHPDWVSGGQVGPDDLALVSFKVHIVIKIVFLISNIPLDSLGSTVDLQRSRSPSEITTTKNRSCWTWNFEWMGIDRWIRRCKHLAKGNFIDNFP